jgi:hypothetical protein
MFKKFRLYWFLQLSFSLLGLHVEWFFVSEYVSNLFQNVSRIFETQHEYTLQYSEFV